MKHALPPLLAPLIQETAIRICACKRLAKFSDNKKGAMLITLSRDASLTVMKNTMGANPRHTKDYKYMHRHSIDELDGALAKRPSKGRERLDRGGKK